jgi:hypothetical protein
MTTAEYEEPKKHEAKKKGGSRQHPLVAGDFGRETGRVANWTGKKEPQDGSIAIPSLLADQEPNIFQQVHPRKGEATSRLAAKDLAFISWCLHVRSRPANQGGSAALSDLPHRAILGLGSLFLRLFSTSKPSFTGVPASRQWSFEAVSRAGKQRAACQHDENQPVAPSSPWLNAFHGMHHACLVGLVRLGPFHWPGQTPAVQLEPTRGALDRDDAGQE